MMGDNLWCPSALKSYLLHLHEIFSTLEMCEDFRLSATQRWASHSWWCSAWWGVLHNPFQFHACFLLFSRLWPSTEQQSVVFEIGSPSLSPWRHKHIRYGCCLPVNSSQLPSLSDCTGLNCAAHRGGGHLIFFFFNILHSWFSLCWRFNILSYTDNVGKHHKAAADSILIYFHMSGGLSRRELM